MTRTNIECAGLYDLVVQVKETIKAESIIDVSTVGGTGGNVFYYFDSVDREGNMESHQVYGKTELVETLINIFTEGGDVDMATLGASGGRHRWIWFVAEREGKETPPAAFEEPSEGQEDKISPLEAENVKIRASSAAIELAEINNIDLSKVTGTLAGGKISKPDVVKYMGNN